MDSIIYKSGVTPYAWWYVSERVFNGNVLVVGSIYENDLRFISYIARRVVCVDGAINNIHDFNNVEYVELNELNDTHFDVVIASLFNKSDSEVNNVRSKINTLDWFVCVLFCRNDLYFGNYSKISFKKIFNTNISWCDNKEISYSMTFPCVSYNGNPVESYLPGCYENNKNRFYFKEKIKSIIFNSPFNRLFVNGVITIKSTIDPSNLFYNKILEKLSRLINCHYNSVFLTNIFYKFGKIILSISSDKSGDYIVIVAFDESARLQRDNEYKTVKALKNINTISKYIPDQYYVININGIYCYSMSKIDGVTVDKDSRYLEKMTLNAFNVIVDIAKVTMVNEGSASLKKTLINDYIDIFKSKFMKYISMPDIDLNKISNELNGIPDVLMHGDSKLENYVLDDKYSVKSIIDWELSELKGFPLLDVLYLITYNMYVTHDEDFISIFFNILTGKINSTYAKMISDYLLQFDISKKQKNILLGVFFLHHFSKRVDVDCSDKIYLKKIETALVVVFNIFSGDEV